MPQLDNASYKKAVRYSVIAHVTLFVILFADFAFFEKTTMKVAVANNQAEPNIVQATAVSHKELKQALSRLDKMDDQRKAEQERLKKEADLAVLKRQQEEEKTKQAQEKAQEAEQQAQQAKEQAQAAQEQAKQAEQKQQQEKIKLAELEDQKQKVEEQRKAEELKLAQAQKKRLDDEKKRAEAQKKKVEAEKKRKQDEAKAKAIEEAKRKKEEQAKLAEAAAAQQKVDEEAQAAQASQVNAEVDKYVVLVQQKIQRNWLVQDSVPPGSYTTVVARIAPGGVVLSVRLVESSGSAGLDRASVDAVYKASPLPVPQDSAAFDRFRELRLKLRPDEILMSGY